ncbi:MAG: hypothetical protein R3F49_11135 [Planctomycetota bacterium]
MLTLHLFAVAASCTAVPAAFGQRVITLAEVGDPLPGGGAVTASGAPEVDVASDGAWVLRCGDGLGGTALLRSGALVLRTGDPLPGASHVTFTGDAHSVIRPGGALCFTHPTGSTPAAGIFAPSYGLFWGGHLILESRVGATVPSAPFLAPVTIEGLALCAVADEGRVLVALYLVEAGSGAAHEALAVLDVGPSGQVVSFDLVGWTGEPAMPGVGTPLNQLLGRAELDEAGNVIWHARAAGVDHLFVGSWPVFSEGAPAPLPGVRWGHQTRPIACDAAGLGSWVARAMLETGEELLVRGAPVAQVARRNGAALAAAGGAAVWFAGFDDAAWLTPDGRVLWRGTWTPSGPGNTEPRDGLFLDDELLCATGDQTDRGGTIVAVHHIDLAPGGRFVALEARVQPPTGGPARLAWLRLELPFGERFGVASLCSTGAPGRLTAYGTARATANDLTVTARDLPRDAYGVLLTARGRASYPLPGGSQGALLLAPPLHFWSDRVARADAQGHLEVTIDLTQPLLGAPPTAGDTWHFQLWFRDRNPTPTTNTTNGVTVTLD